MDTFLDFQTAVLSDLTIDSGSTLFPTTTVKLAINRAYRKAGALFKWPSLEDARKTSTIASGEYYDFPDNWMSDSMYRLEVDGYQYGETPDGSPMLFSDYLQWRADTTNTNSTTKKWSVQNRRFFIYPIPTTNGSNNISIWGRKAVSTLTADGDTTIFSYHKSDCNEAIVLEAVAILRAKGEDQNSSSFKSAESKQILASAWQKIRQEQAKYEKVQPFLSVPDFFGGTSTVNNTIGNF